MRYNPETHHRRSLRLPGRNYAQPGIYFVTILTHERKCLFGDVIDGQMRLNSIGRIVNEEWVKSSRIRREVALGPYVIMPNHVHGIVIIHVQSIDVSVGTHGRASLPSASSSSALQRAPRSLGSFVAGFKSAATKRINELSETPGFRVWQNQFHDHIVRKGHDIIRVIQYIRQNPSNWRNDKENPATKQ